LPVPHSLRIQQALTLSETMGLLPRPLENRHEEDVDGALEEGTAARLVEMHFPLVAHTGDSTARTRRGRPSSWRGENSNADGAYLCSGVRISHREQQYDVMYHAPANGPPTDGATTRLDEATLHGECISKGSRTRRPGGWSTSSVLGPCLYGPVHRPSDDSYLLGPLSFWVIPCPASGILFASSSG